MQLWKTMSLFSLQKQGYCNIRFNINSNDLNVTSVFITFSPKLLFSYNVSPFQQPQASSPFPKKISYVSEYSNQICKKHTFSYFQAIFIRPTQVYLSRNYKKNAMGCTTASRYNAIINGYRNTCIYNWMELMESQVYFTCCGYLVILLGPI